MKSITPAIISFGILLATVLPIGGCKATINDTTVHIVDSVRVYSPIIRGQQVRFVYELVNTGDYPLLITDVLPSCGCITIDKEMNVVVPTGKKMIIPLRFDSSKNVGQVHQVVRLYGNIAPTGMAQMEFEINIVPELGDSKDYEEAYYEQHPVDVTLRYFSTGNRGTHRVDEPDEE